MPKIVIVGSSIAAVSAIDAIRAKDVDSEIVLVAPEGVLPYDRTLLPLWATKQIKEAQLLVQLPSYYEQQKVQLVLNERLARVSLKRHQLTMESKNHISYERLILLDLGEAKLPSIKGHQREGVYDCYHWNSIKEIVKEIPYLDNIVVSVSSFQGLNIACALSAFKKEVVVVCKGAGVLSEIFDDETSALLKQIVEGKGLRVICENAIDEILGDSEVKAVRLKTGKVIAAETVILDEVEPQVKPLAETDLVEGSLIATDEYLKVPNEEVYAADVLCSGYGSSVEESKVEGCCVGANVVLPGAVAYEQPVCSYVFGINVVEGFAAGVFRLSDQGREFLKFDGPQNIYKKIYALGSTLQGTVLFNAPAQRQRILDAIIQRSNITGQEEALLD